MKKIKYSFKDWCLDNNHQKWLELWDYNLNEKKPEEVSYGSEQKYYFKCPRGLHPSHLTAPNWITCNKNKKIICSMCESFAQWCLDNNHEDWLLLWDDVKNLESPWSISAKTGKKCYFKCSKNIHESELKNVRNLTDGKANLFCIACKSIGQYIIDLYGKDMLDKIWSDKNIKSPYAIYAKGDVMCWFKCFNKDHPDYSMQAKKYVNGQRCNICSGHRTVVGINDIATTHPHLIDFFVDKNDAKKYTCGSGESVFIKCPICGYERPMFIYNLVKRNFSCPCCGDGVSYSNKFMLSVLRQLEGLNNLYFKPETVFNWSKNVIHNNLKLCGNKRYDFYVIYKKNIIVECHGLQHYEEWYLSEYGARTLKEEQENDLIKKELALLNNIDECNYIVIDCRESSMDYIKNSIMKSDLPKILNFVEDDIDWNLCAEMANCSFVKISCDMWNAGEKSIANIAKQLKISKFSVGRYLKQGAEIGLCNFPIKNIKVA